jgi:acyl-CoA synthetase (AMP-forming)/AMP-acid ligase II
MPNPTKTSSTNLFSALRAAFPPDLDACAVETDSGLLYSWRDLDEATAMVANLLQSLNLEAGARIAAQVEKSVESLILYLATLRSGLVYLPLNTAYQSAEMAYFLADANPAVVVCTARNFGWVSKLAFRAGCGYVFSLNEDRTGSLLERAARFRRSHATVPTGRSSRHYLHERHDWAKQRSDALPRQPAEQRAGAQGLLGMAKCWRGWRCVNPCPSDFPRARALCGGSRCTDQRQ